MANIRKKHLVIFPTLVVLLVSLTVVGIFIYKSYPAWIYPQLLRNQVPVQQLITAKLPKTSLDEIPSIVSHGSRYQYKVALTFDTDLTWAMQKLISLGVVKSWYNYQIKQILDQQNVKSTIFLTQLWVETYPKEARALAADPLIEVGIQSYSNPANERDCLNSLRVSQAQASVKKITGVEAKYFRVVGSCFNINDLAEIKKLNLKVIQWDLISDDGLNKDVSAIVQNVETKVQNGSIIAFHLEGGEFAPKTAEALLQIIAYLKKRDYQLVTISELLNESN